MSNKKRERYKKTLRSMEQQRTQVISCLLQMRAMLRGSYARVHTKCGKDNCWCKEGQGHPHSRITWTDKGKGFTRKVPKDQIAWVRRMTENYRAFRSLRKRLLQLEDENRKCLDEIEKILVQTTRARKDFLKTYEDNRSKEQTKVSKNINQPKSKNV